MSKKFTVNGVSPKGEQIKIKKPYQFYLMTFIIAHMSILFLMNDSFLGFKTEELSKINEKKLNLCI